VCSSCPSVPVLVSLPINSPVLLSWCPDPIFSFVFLPLGFSSPTQTPLKDSRSSLLLRGRVLQPVQLQGLVLVFPTNLVTVALVCHSVLAAAHARRVPLRFWAADLVLIFPLRSSECRQDSSPRAKLWFFSDSVSFLFVLASRT
jgi:hypothetical protein